QGSGHPGPHWQSRPRNLPGTPGRALTGHGPDLVTATHGRSFWILDAVPPTRQARAALAGARAYLCPPAVALRVRANRNTDTPFPPDEPMAPNPPDGAVLDYWLPAPPRERLPGA